MFGMGGETGGSIASLGLQRLVGLKPSLGLVLRRHRALVHARRHRTDREERHDVALAMDVLAVKDPDDLYAPSTCGIRRRTTRAPAGDVHRILDRTRWRGSDSGCSAYIGKGTPELGVSDPIDPEVAALFEQAEADLEAEGATLIEVTPPAHTIWFVDQPNNTARWTSLGSAELPLLRRGRPRPR